MDDRPENPAPLLPHFNPVSDPSFDLLVGPRFPVADVPQHPRIGRQWAEAFPVILRVKSGDLHTGLPDAELGSEVRLDFVGRFASFGKVLDRDNRADSWKTETPAFMTPPSPIFTAHLFRDVSQRLVTPIRSLDSFGPAIFPVAWAGAHAVAELDGRGSGLHREVAPHSKFSTPRNAPLTITERRLFHPCLESFMRALPYTFRNIDAPEGSVVSVTISGEAGGEWFVVQSGHSWIQTTEAATTPVPDSRSAKTPHGNSLQNDSSAPKHSVASLTFRSKETSPSAVK